MVEKNKSRNNKEVDIVLLGNIFLAVLVFVVIVLIHEFGHFIVAKLSGIRVEEFALGMGPKIFGKQKGETLYSVRLFPLGGLCKLTGEDGDSKDSKSFTQKPILIRMAVIFFGPFMNFLLACLIFSMIITQVPVISEVIKDKPAHKAGIIKGDKIIKINDTTIKGWDDVKHQISNSNNIPLKITIKRKSQLEEITLIPLTEDIEEGAVIGIKPTLRIGGLSFTQGIKTTLSVTGSMFEFLFKLFTRKESAEDVSGVIGIFVIINEAAKYGLLYVLNLTAFLSLNLAIINLLPIPALDGGRLLFLLIEGVRKKPLEAEKEGFIHFIGFVMLMIFAAIITFKDLIRFNIINIFK